MGPVIGDILPFAIGVAISPVPIIAVILMLFSARARQNGPAFLVGWVVGLTAVVVLVMAIAGASGAGSGTASTLASLVKAGLGILLVALGFAQWRKRPGPGETAAMPKWMDAIDSLAPVRAFGLGLLLSAVNPKNLTLAIGAALTIAQASLSLGGAAASVIAFVVLGSVSIAVPVAYYLVGGESAKRTLDGWKTWLGANNTTVMAVLLVVMGAVLFGKGIGPLIG